MIYSLFHVSKQTNITCPSFNYHDVTIPSLQNPTKISVNIESTQHCIARKIDRHIFRSNIDLGGQGWNHWTRNDEFYKNAKRDRKWLGVIWGSRGAKTVKNGFFQNCRGGSTPTPLKNFLDFFWPQDVLEGSIIYKLTEFERDRTINKQWGGIFVWSITVAPPSGRFENCHFRSVEDHELRHISEGRSDIFNRFWDINFLN